jgi:hypothetical protein
MNNYIHGFRDTSLRTHILSIEKHTVAGFYTVYVNGDVLTLFSREQIIDFVMFLREAPLAVKVRNLWLSTHIATPFVRQEGPNFVFFFKRTFPTQVENIRADVIQFRNCFSELLVAHSINLF